MFCRALTIAFAVAALAVPVSQAQLERLPWEGGGAQTTQTTQTPQAEVIPYLSHGIGVDESLYAGEAGVAAVRPDDRGFAAGIGRAQTAPLTTSGEGSDSSTNWTTLFVAVAAGLALVLLIGGGVAVSTRRHGENVTV